MSLATGSFPRRQLGDCDAAIRKSWGSAGKDPSKFSAKFSGTTYVGFGQIGTN